VKSIPVIGNGDVKTVQDVAEMIRQTGCAGVMIGRAALAAPWIFRDAWAYLSTGQLPKPLSLEQKIQTIRDHFRLMCQVRGEKSAVIGFRQRITWYAKQLTPSKKLRVGMVNVHTAEDFERLLTEFEMWKKTQP
jgi:tRNA-dihydrouridine synthase B